MNVKIRDSEGKEHKLTDVERIFNVAPAFTQFEELKGSILIVHRTNHCEKYRLYKGGTIVSIEDF